MKPQGRLAIAFTPYSGQPRAGVVETVGAAGFTNVQLVEGDGGFAVLASRLI